MGSLGRPEAVKASGETPYGVRGRRWLGTARFPLFLGFLQPLTFLPPRISGKPAEVGLVSALPALQGIVYVSSFLNEIPTDFEGLLWFPFFSTDL